MASKQCLKLSFRGSSLIIGERHQIKIHGPRILSFILFRKKLETVFLVEFNHAIRIVGVNGDEPAAGLLLLIDKQYLDVVHDIGPGL